MRSVKCKKCVLQEMQPDSTPAPCCFDDHLQKSKKKRKKKRGKKKILLSIMEIRERGCRSQGGLVLRRGWE